MPVKFYGPNTPLVLAFRVNMQVSPLQIDVFRDDPGNTIISWNQEILVVEVTHAGGVPDIILAYAIKDEINSSVTVSSVPDGSQFSVLDSIEMQRDDFVLWVEMRWY